MRLGELIQKWRLVNSLNTQQVGQQIGVSSSAILLIEKGKVPDGETLIKIMAWLFGKELSNAEANKISSPENS